MEIKELRKYAEKILNGFNYEYLNYSDSNGLSMYFNVNGIKVRFSDHGYTNTNRIQNEVNFDIRNLGSEYQKFYIEQSLLHLEYKLGNKDILNTKRPMLMPSGKFLTAFGFIKKSDYLSQRMTEIYYLIEVKLRHIGSKKYFALKYLGLPTSKINLPSSTHYLMDDEQITSFLNKIGAKVVSRSYIKENWIYTVKFYVPLNEQKNQIKKNTLGELWIPKKTTGDKPAYKKHTKFL